MEQNDDEIYILKEKDFILISDKNIQYKVKLFITNNDLFCINLFTNKINPSKKYSLSLGMNDLIKNRFFKIFINIDEIFRELENKIEKSNIIEDSNLIYLDIPIGLNVINDIILEIKEAKKTNEEIIQELKAEINNQNNIIKNKDIKIKELENQLKLNENLKKQEKNIIKNKDIKIKELENQLNENLKKHENEINLLKKEIEERKNNIIKKNIFPESTIINNEQWNLIKDWINPNLDMKFNLIFKKSRDGSNVSDFHRFCDNKGKIILLIETNNNFKFGGYTPLNFDESDQGKNDNNSFLFSITNNQKYTKKNQNDSIHCRKNWIAFGRDNYDLYFDNHLNSGGLQSNNYTSYLNDLNLNGGNGEFITKEIEVYQVQF